MEPACCVQCSYMSYFQQSFSYVSHLHSKMFSNWRTIQFQNYAVLYWITIPGNFHHKAIKCICSKSLNTGNHKHLFNFDLAHQDHVYWLLSNIPLSQLFDCSLFSSILVVISNIKYITPSCMCNFIDCFFLWTSFLE